jgi:hypothetical protein
MNYATLPLNMDEVRRRNHAAGFHFFSPDTLRWWGSRVGGTLFGGRYFVTSEWTSFDKTGRAYTVREAMPDGSIDTVGEFLAHPTREHALRAIRALLRDEGT